MTARFEFSAAPGATFECALDGTHYSPCTSPHVTGALGWGPHQFLIRTTLGAATGNPVAHRWTIINEAPEAINQLVVTTAGIPVDVTLSAVDTDDVTFRVVDAPRHGSLEDSPAGVTYTPFDGFVGFDAFSFEADDAQETSDPGTVNVIVGAATPPAATIQPTPGQPDPTNQNPIRFDIEFDQVVTGFDADDVIVTGSGDIDLDGLTIAITTLDTARRYQATINGVSGTGILTATVRADAANNTTLQPNTASAPASITYDDVDPRPTLTLTSPTPIQEGIKSITIGIEFDEPTTGLTIDDIGITTPHHTGASLAATTSGYQLTIINLDKAGTLTVRLDTGATTDTVGNPSTPATLDITITNQTLPISGSPITTKMIVFITLFLIGLALRFIARRRPATPGRTGTGRPAT